MKRLLWFHHKNVFLCLWCNFQPFVKHLKHVLDMLFFTLTLSQNSRTENKHTLKTVVLKDLDLNQPSHQVIYLICSRLIRTGNTEMSLWPL